MNRNAPPSLWIGTKTVRQASRSRSPTWLSQSPTSSSPSSRSLSRSPTLRSESLKSLSPVHSPSRSSLRPSSRSSGPKQPWTLGLKKEIAAMKKWDQMQAVTKVRKTNWRRPKLAFPFLTSYLESDSRAHNLTRAAKRLPATTRTNSVAELIILARAPDIESETIPEHDIDRQLDKRIDRVHQDSAQAKVETLTRAVTTNTIRRSVLNVGGWFSRMCAPASPLSLVEWGAQQ